MIDFLKRLTGMGGPPDEMPDDKRRWGGEPFISSAPVAGIYVNETRALNLSTVWRAVTLVSAAVARLPWHVYENTENGLETRPDHPVDVLLDFRVNPEPMGAYRFRKALMAHTMLWGNGYAEIERTRSGQPIALWLIEPDRVHLDRDSKGRLFYLVTNEGGVTTTMEPSQIFHVRGLSLDGVTGLSAIRFARETLSLGMAMERFGAGLFGNSARPAGVLEHPGTLSDESAKRIRENWETQYRGSGNSGKTAVLEEGMKFSPITIPPEDAQFLDSRKFGVVEICRWFGIPPHKAYELDRATFTNIEHQSKEYVDDSLIDWIQGHEEEADLKLFPGEPVRRYRTLMDMGALLRGDAKAQSELSRAMFGVGAWSPNDILRFRGEKPMGPEGDIRMVPMNMVPLGQAHLSGHTRKQRRGDR